MCSTWRGSETSWTSEFSDSEPNDAAQPLEHPPSWIERRIDQNLGDLGEISYIDSQTPQTLIYVTNNEQKFCFPMNKEFVKNINTANRIIEVLIPKELLNLN